jgi:hypothetical protein
MALRCDLPRTSAHAAERPLRYVRWRNSRSTFTPPHMRTIRLGVGAAARGTETREHRPVPDLGGARTPEQLMPRLVNKASPLRGMRHVYRLNWLRYPDRLVTHRGENFTTQSLIVGEAGHGERLHEVSLSHALLLQVIPCQPASCVTSAAAENSALRTSSVQRASSPCR